jgi:hypothetical protein
MLRRLSAVHGELAGIADREGAGDESAEELGIERHLLAAKAASILAAIELALGHVQPRHTLAANSIGRQARAEMGSITQALRPADVGRGPRLDARAQLHRAWLGVQAVGGKVTTRAAGIPIAAVIAAGVLIAVAFSLRPTSDPFAAVASRPTPTHEGQVAGGTPAFSPAASGAASPEASSPKPLRFTFDTLISYAAPGLGWELRGESGLAEITPFPDPFDRSLRLANLGGSGSAVICRRGLPDADLVSIDLSADNWRGVSVELRQGTGAVEMRVDDGNHLLFEADGRTNEVANRFEATGWQRLTISLDLVQGFIEMHIEPRGGYAGLSSGMSLPAAWTATTRQTTNVCISAPSNPGEELYVDNLTISAGGA